MSAGPDLFPSHRYVVLGRLGLQAELGKLLPELPARAAEVEAIKAALAASRETSRLVLIAARMAEGKGSGKVVPLGFRRRSQARGPK